MQDNSCNASINAPITELNCNASSLTLEGIVDAPLGDNLIRWSNGETGLSNTITEGGNYTFEVYDPVTDNVICTASVNVTENFTTPPLTGISSTSVMLDCNTPSVAINGSTPAGMDVSVSSTNGYNGNSLSFEIAQPGTYNISIINPATG